MRRSERQGSWLTWAAMGLGVGVLAGFTLAEMVGPLDERRMRRAVDRLLAGDEDRPAVERVQADRTA